MMDKLIKGIYKKKMKLCLKMEQSIKVNGKEI